MKSKYTVYITANVVILLGLFFLATIPNIQERACRHKINNVDSFVQPAGQLEQGFTRSNDKKIKKLFNINKPFSYLPSTPLSKDVIIYGAYFDERARNGHSNVTVFLISVNRTIFDRKWITQCGVGSATSNNFEIRFVQETHLMHNWLGNRKFPFEQVALDCYDLPVVNGSRAFVAYQSGKNVITDEFVSESLTPLMIPAPRIQPSGEHNLSVLTCTKAHNRGVSWLPEFIRYQKTLGVDHVHLAIIDTFIQDGGFRDYLLSDEFTRTAIQEGYLSITVWHEWYDDNEFYVHGTIFQFLDCMYRFRGTYDYVFPLDSDDFFNPSIPGKTKLKEYITDYCSTEPFISCAFKWLIYYPGVCGMLEKVGEDGNVTKYLKPHNAKEQLKFKSLHSMKAIVDFSFHDATCKRCLLPGYSVRRIEPEIAYAAHNRLYMDKNRAKVC